MNRHIQIIRGRLYVDIDIDAIKYEVLDYILSYFIAKFVSVMNIVEFYAFILSVWILSLYLYYS